MGSFGVLSAGLVETPICKSTAAGRYILALKNVFPYRALNCLPRLGIPNSLGKRSANFRAARRTTSNLILGLPSVSLLYSCLSRYECRLHVFAVSYFLGSVTVQRDNLAS